MRKPLKQARSDTPQYSHTAPLCARVALLTWGQWLCGVALWPSADTHIKERVHRNTHCTWAQGIPGYQLDAVWSEVVHIPIHTHTNTSRLQQRLHLTTSSWFVTSSLWLTLSRAAITNNLAPCNFSCFWQEKWTFLIPGQSRWRKRKESHLFQDEKPLS